MWTSMARSRQQTFAKMTRERLVRERRERKQEKRHAAAAERKTQASGEVSVPIDGVSTDASAIERA
jgi:hypothetical protein